VKILVTGADGQLGHELAALLGTHGFVEATRRATLDVASADAIVRAVRAFEPDLIVNAAAYTAVDLAEQRRDEAFAVNAHAPGVLAEEAKRSGATLIHFSTDYVFDGSATAPYREDAAAAPMSIYGASKLEGERRIGASGASALVFRTSWVYGLRGRNFLLTIRRLAAERDELRIVDDQIGVPNWCRTLARAVDRIVAIGPAALADRAGLYHLSCRGQATWFDFARAIVGDSSRPRIVPITTDQYPTPARRPPYSVLDTGRFERTFGFALPDWRSALAECLSAPAEPPLHERRHAVG
jgi:dTDP-4-dehydrorhamnose reductase